MERFIDALGLESAEFHEISQGDIVGRVVGGMLNIGVADHIVKVGTVSEWLTHLGYVVADDMGDSVVYRVPLEPIVIHEMLEASREVVDYSGRLRRGSFPEDGTLLLTESVGDWEEGLIFHAGLIGWYLYDPEMDATTDKVDTKLLYELFEQGKLVVTERF